MTRGVRTRGILAVVVDTDATVERRPTLVRAVEDACAGTINAPPFVD